MLETEIKRFAENHKPRLHDHTKIEVIHLLVHGDQLTSFTLLNK